MSLEQCAAVSAWADELRSLAEELTMFVLNQSRAIPGPTPGLTDMVDRAIRILHADPRKATQQVIARPTERTPPPSFTHLSFRAPATPLEGEDFEALPDDREARRMLSTIPPDAGSEHEDSVSDLVGETYESDRVALEILGGVPG